MNIFTNKQESQIRKALDRLMQVGTAHITLFDVTEHSEDTGNSLKWWKVKAQMPYTLYNYETNEIYTDGKIYEIHVGVFADRRRHVLTTLDLSQHDTRGNACKA